MTLARRIERHNKAASEATWTQEQAIEWAKKFAHVNKRWPARCWRVEGGIAGNSKLLTFAHAESAAARVGGTVVRLIPTPTELGLPAMTINQSRVDGMPACPKCKSEVGFPCRAHAKGGKLGKSRPPHVERVEASMPPPVPLPQRAAIHGADKQPHTACASPGVCNCTCRFCRQLWKTVGKPGAPRPARDRRRGEP